MEHGKLPQTLIEALDYFREHENCHDFLVSIRWPNGVRCPHCGSPVVRYMESVRRWKCYEKHPQPQFSLKTGTIFEESPITLRKWLAAVWMIVNCKNGISSYEIHREIGVTQKTAWFMGHRIRTAIHEGTFERMLGDDGEEVEVDETFIGGKARNMHADVKARRITGRGPNDKTAVLGMLERGGVVTTKVVCNRRKRTLQGSRYRWLTNPENMDEERWEKFAELRDSALQTARAWGYKEHAMTLWAYRSRAWARKAWMAWYRSAIRCRLEPVKRVARMVKRHLDGIVTAVVDKVTNARAESINAGIQKMKYSARGFRNRKRFRNAIYFHLGGLDLYPVGVTP